jgi:Domain of unknown function (DUF1707)
MAMRYYAPFPDRDREPYRSMPRHVLRIGDAERDAAAADLGEHYAAGRLTLDELHERLSQVFAAKTHGALWKVMADLPGTHEPGAHGPRMNEPGVQAPAPNSTIPQGLGPYWQAWPGWQRMGASASAEVAERGDAMSTGAAEPGDSGQLAEQTAVEDRRSNTPSDRAGRFAALSLLILAMLIWLFTALLFTRHGYYYNPGPWGH